MHVQMYNLHIFIRTHVATCTYARPVRFFFFFFGFVNRSETVRAITTISAERDGKIFSPSTFVSQPAKTVKIDYYYRCRCRNFMRLHEVYTVWI